MPVYGLAENCVGLTFTPVNRGPRIKKVNRDVLMKKGIAKIDENGMELVSNGFPLKGYELRVVNEKGGELEENHIGEIEFRGQSSTKGYYNSPEKTRELFHDGWPRTGDLGFLSDGELFITGRKKDIIIKAGRNISPQEMEEKVAAAVANCHTRRKPT